MEDTKNNFFSIICQSREEYVKEINERTKKCIEVIDLFKEALKEHFDVYEFKNSGFESLRIEMEGRAKFRKKPLFFMSFERSEKSKRIIKISFDGKWTEVFSCPLDEEMLKDFITDFIKFDIFQTVFDTVECTVRTPESVNILDDHCEVPSGFSITQEDIEKIVESAGSTFEIEVDAQHESVENFKGRASVGNLKITDVKFRVRVEDGKFLFSGRHDGFFR